MERRNSDRNKRMENVKSSGFVEKKINAAFCAFSEIYIWSFEQKEYVDGYICIFSIIYGMGLPYPASTYKLCEKGKIFVQ
jgi:hypothetical protein